MRFTGATIPPGSTITHAHLILHCTSANATDGVKSQLSCEAAADSAQLAGADDTARDTDFHARTLTAKVDWDFDDDWSLDGDYDSPSIIAQVQAVIDLPGWHSGHALSVVWEDFDKRSTANNQFRQAASWDYATGGHAYAPKLHIIYTPPVPATLQVKSGSFAKRTSTGSQAVTGVGFQPKLLILFGVANTSDCAAGFQYGFGASDDTTSKAIGGWSWDARGGLGSDTDRRDASKAITFVTTVGGIVAEAGLTSFDTDGFTLNWTTNNVAAWVIYYLAIGGGAEYDVASFEASAGSNAYTHVGFKPDLLLLFGAPAGTGEENSSFGFADGHGNQFAMAGASENSGINPTNTARYQRTDKCFASLDPVTAIHVESEASLVSMDSLGFTLNWTGSTQAIISVAIRGANVKVGALINDYPGGDLAITGVGFQPKGALFAGFNTLASESIQVHNRFSLGVADTNRNQGSIWVGDVDNVSNDTITDQGTSDDLCVIQLDAGSPSGVTGPVLKSWDVDGFTLTFPSVTVEQIGYFLLGDYAVTAVFAVAATSGVASLSNVLVVTPLVAAASSGVASLSGVAVAAPATVVAAASSGVASLSSVIVRSLSILAAATTSGVASVANVAMTAASILAAGAVNGIASLPAVIVKSLSILAVAAASGVASLSNVTVRSLSILAVAAASGVASLSNVTVRSLSILSAAATSGAASVSNVSLKAAAILAAASTSGVATAASVFLRAAAVLGVASVSGVASFPNATVSAPARLSVAATSGYATLPNVVLSSGSVMPAILTVAPSSGLATIPNIKVASLVRLTVATTSGVASLSNVTVRSLSILGVASMSGAATFPNVTVSAVFSPLTVAAASGAASMSNVAVTAPARLAIGATSGSASLPNVTVSAATVGELNLASMNGAASVANVSIEATAILGVASISGAASLNNVTLCSLSILAIGSTTGLASFPEVTIMTGVTPLVVAATNGAASLPNVIVSSPSIFTIAPTSGVASVAGLDIVTGTTLLVGTVNGTASVANTLVSAAAILAIDPSSGAASVPNVTVLAVTPGTLTVDPMSGIASLPNVSIGRAATVIDLSASYEHTIDLSASYEPDIDLEASYG